jgi:CBS domain-containing protein
MPNDLVGQIMSTDVLTFHTTESVPEAAQALVDRGYDGAPVVDDGGRLVGMLSSADLMLQDSNLHLPTVVAMFGVTVELPLSNRRFDRELKKALASTVGELMHDDPVTIRTDASVRDAATLMHDRNVSRLPVVDADGKLVGIVGRGDVLRYLVGGDTE